MEWGRGRDGLWSDDGGGDGLWSGAGVEMVCGVGCGGRDGLWSGVVVVVEMVCGVRWG